MSKLSINPFGVVIEVIIDETVYYVVLTNDFVTYKTFGNYEIDPRPFVIMDSSMCTLSEENEELYDQIEKIIDKHVIEEQPTDEDEE